MEVKDSQPKFSFLVDHDIEGYAKLLWNTLASDRWIELCTIEMLMFIDVGLPINSTDRKVWRFAQEHKLILLTANRNMDGMDSLEQSIRQENISTSIPVITIGRVERLKEKSYECDQNRSMLFV